MAHRPLLAGAAAALLLVLQPTSAVQAQDGFLFRAPQVQVTLRAGPLVPSARSDLFDDITTELTLERRDFRAPFVGGEVALLIGPRLDLALGVGWAASQTTSEYRDLIGDDGLPIVQTTRLRTVPVTATARLYPVPRGRTMSGLAWIPARATPYVGGGAGMTWYRLQQEGEFVDRRTDDIFISEFESAANALTVHGVAGLDYWFMPRLALNVEGRYMHGSAPVTGSYLRFDNMDLSGLQAAVGVSFRW
jgi:opacity protein-like surface antigen